MPRPLRFDFPDAIYHVTSRGNGRSVIFRSDADHDRFVAQLADNLHLAGVVLYAYVLMDNCFQLLLRTPRANLSRFMQRLCTAYATYARSRHRRRGRQFHGRFQAKLVQGDGYLRAVSRYMHLIPVKTAASRRLNRAARLRMLKTYPWSSFPGYLAAKNAQKFVTYDVLREFARSAAVGRRKYRAFVEIGLSEDDGAILEAMGASRYAIGDHGFVTRTERTIQRRRTGSHGGRDRASPRNAVSLTVIDKAVAKHFRVATTDLARHGRKVGAAKIVAVELACRLTELSLRAIGAHYGGIGSAAVSTIHRKVRNGQHDVDKPLAAVLQKLVSGV